MVVPSKVEGRAVIQGLHVVPREFEANLRYKRPSLKHLSVNWELGEGREYGYTMEKGRVVGKFDAVLSWI